MNSMSRRGDVPSPIRREAPAQGMGSEEVCWVTRRTGHGENLENVTETGPWKESPARQREMQAVAITDMRKERGLPYAQGSGSRAMSGNQGHEH